VVTGSRVSTRRRPQTEQPACLTQGHLDHLFGLGSGDQDPGVDAEVERAEGPVPQDVLERLTRRPARRQRPGRRCLGRRHHRRAPGPRSAEHLLDDEARLVALPAHDHRQLVDQRTAVDRAPVGH
jgi:glyoxylase-like metal-dependent hydrolase (beta-lactamase superfamily II)